MHTEPSRAEDRFLSGAEAAALLSMSAGHLANLRFAGGGAPYLKIGRAVRYERAALLDWARLKTFTSTSQDDTRH